jgi:para-aminobenzoate synthetase component 1
LFKINLKSGHPKSCILMKPVQPWYWRSLPLLCRTGSQVFDALFRRHHEIATLLESPSTNLAGCQPEARYSICAGAPRIADGRYKLWAPAVGEILPFLRSLLQRPRAGEFGGASSGENFTASPPENLPFTGGWLGWLGYDLAWEIERLPRLKDDPLPFPVAYWYEPACFAVLDRHEQVLWLAASDPAELDNLQSRWEEKAGESVVERRIASEFPLSARAEETPPFPAPDFHMSQADYETAVWQAKKYIRAGDIFQANLSLRFEARTAADSWSIYRALQQINPSPFASYWQTPWGDLISCSPERLVRLVGRQAETRPIAGTRARGTTPAQDEELAQELIGNSKERAEHIMLVDLERNDLGRVCEWGSVGVSELLSIERYSHVMHLVSNVEGTLRPEFDAADLIRAMFPGGTITGCPKVRCMEIIEELEPVRRSLFYGSCGYLDWRGNLDLNILIRTLLYKTEEPPLNSQSQFAPSNIVWGQVGAGIVADSDPEKEWYESLHKAEAQLAALRLARMRAFI